MIDISDDIWEVRDALPLPSETKARVVRCVGWLRVDAHSRELHTFIFEREFVDDYLCIGWVLKDIIKKK